MVASNLHSEPTVSAPSERGRLLARPLKSAAPIGKLKPGTSPLRAGQRGGLMIVPESYDPARPAPLVVFFHGAGGEARQGLDIFKQTAEQLGAILLVPESAGSSWDVIEGGYGPDVAFLDEALETAFSTAAIDPHRIVASGFSDGASYALSLALGNGDLFTHVLAFSPGFAAPRETHGVSRYFISHGTKDTVLPIARCSRVIVRRLQDAGYPVQYLEFQDGHAIPPDILGAGLKWLQSGG